MAVQFVLLAILCVAIGSSVASNNGLGLTPPMGWNTWCTDGHCGRDVCTAKEIMAVADAMASNGMKDLGYEYINLDDCWADYRDKDGNIVEDKHRFPDGIEAVIKHVNSKGLKFGLYTDAGLYTCSSGQRLHKIPGSYGHYSQDAKTYADWGVEYVKMDWCNTKINGTQLDPKVQYPQMSKALNETGKKIFFDSCEWGVENPWEWMGQYANSWRSGPDHHDEWKSTAGIIEHNSGLGSYAGPGGWNDWDFIMTGGQGCPNNEDLKHCPGQSDVEYMTEFSMWVMGGSPLLVATDIRNMTTIMKTVLLNKEMIGISQDKMGKVASRVGFASDCAEKNSCQVWGRPLSDGSHAVALYNNGSSRSDITLEFSMIGLKDTCLVRDVWMGKDMGKFTGSYKTSVESHGVSVLKVKEA